MQKQKKLPEHTGRGRKSSSPPQQVQANSGSGNQFSLSQLGSARSLPDQIRTGMEASMGADFSGVRIYESPMIAENGAQAVASGKNIAFAPGQLDFHSSAGLGLLGHELSHVASQARGEVSGRGFVNNSALERKADEDGARAASAFDSLSGRTLTPMSAGAGVGSAQSPVQAKKGKRSIPKLDPKDPLSLADMAIRSERSRLVMRHAADAKMSPKNMFYDYDQDKNTISEGVRALDPEGRYKFHDALLSNNIYAMASMDLDSPMEKYGDEYFDSMAYNMAYSVFGFRDPMAEMVATNEYMPQDDPEDFVWDRFQAGKERLNNAGTGRNAYGDVVGSVQSKKKSRSNIKAQLKRLKEEGLLRKHRR